MLGPQLFSIGTRPAAGRGGRGCPWLFPPSPSHWWQWGQLVNPYWRRHTQHRAQPQRRSQVRVGPIRPEGCIPSAHGAACAPAPGCGEVPVFAPGPCPEAGSSAPAVRLSRCPACREAYLHCTNKQQNPCSPKGKGKKPKQTKTRNQQYSLSRGGPPPSSARSPRGDEESYQFKKGLTRKEKKLKEVLSKIIMSHGRLKQVFMRKQVNPL